MGVMVPGLAAGSVGRQSGQGIQPDMTKQGNLSEKHDFLRYRGHRGSTGTHRYMRDMLGMQCKAYIAVTLSVAFQTQAW